MPFADSRNAAKSAAAGRKKGGEATQAKSKPLPSETFDWAKALRLHRKTAIEIYGPPETWDWGEETDEKTEETA